MERSGTEDLEELRSYIKKLEDHAEITERESIALSCIKYCLFERIGIYGNFRGRISLFGSVPIIDSLNIVFEALENPDRSAIFELHERIYQYFKSPAPPPLFIPNYQEANENGDDVVIPHQDDDDDDPIPF